MVTGSTSASTKHISAWIPIAASKATVVCYTNLQAEIPMFTHRSNTDGDGDDAAGNDKSDLLGCYG